MKSFISSVGFQSRILLFWAFSSLSLSCYLAMDLISISSTLLLSSFPVWSMSSKHTITRFNSSNTNHFLRHGNTIQTHSRIHSQSGWKKSTLTKWLWLESNNHIKCLRQRFLVDPLESKNPCKKIDGLFIPWQQMYRQSLKLLNSFWYKLKQIFAGDLR